MTEYAYGYVINVIGVKIMSLREQWYTARSQRQQEVIERKQEVATFLQETRSHLNEVWLEQRQQRVAYVAAIKNYVWG